MLAPRMAAELPKGEGTDYTIYPHPLTEPYKARRFTVGELLYGAIGIAREDKAARYRQFANNYVFFGAPVALFFAREKAHGPAQWADIGGYLQTVCLLARDHGLHTCPQQAWVSFHRTVRSSSISPITSWSIPAWRLAMRMRLRRLTNGARRANRSVILRPFRVSRISQQKSAVRTIQAIFTATSI
jgi:hypothetical protein